MLPKKAGLIAVLMSGLGAASGCTAKDGEVTRKPDAVKIGDVSVRTMPFDADLILRSGTFTPSGSVLVSYAEDEATDRRELKLATLLDDGINMRTFFEGTVPARPKDNGLRFMVFPDNERIFLGDFILECEAALEVCEAPELVPVAYPEEIADGDHIGHRWSEIIVSPDNRHVAWTTLFANYSAMVFTGELERTEDGYRIIETRIVSTVDSFLPDPLHDDGVIPQAIRGGEVKQFVGGGARISLAGALERDLADSTVINLVDGTVEAVTDAPGYDETTIFSPDERLGVVMTSRFSPETDLALLGLMPRPYPAALNMGLNGLAYNYSVSGVRQQREGNIGPALIEIEASKSEHGYRGINLNTEEDWVFNSPLSWHPDSKKAMWIERERAPRRGPQDESGRIQIVTLPDYHPAPTVSAGETPDDMAYAISDLSVVQQYAGQSKDIDVKVYGQHSGYLTYVRTPMGLIEKSYMDFSDDGEHVYSGKETLEFNPHGNSTYRADVTLAGPTPGAMKLQITFSPMTDFYNPTSIVFDGDEGGARLSRGYVDYDGQRLEVADLIP